MAFIGFFPCFASVASANTPARPSSRHHQGFRFWLDRGQYAAMQVLSLDQRMTIKVANLTFAPTSFA
jgi:hypothetical protein